MEITDLTLNGWFSPWGKECTMQLWRYWIWKKGDVSFFSACLLLVMQRPPVLPPALVDTEALSQGCSSALLFRDNDKALNPSVDLTFVPPLFLNCLQRSGVAIWPVLGGLGVCLGRGDFRSPPLFGLATPQPPHSCRQNPAWSARYPKSLCGVCYGGNRKWAEKRRKKKSLLLLERDFEVWTPRHITDEMFTFDFPFQTVISRLLTQIMLYCITYLNNMC